MTTTLTDKQAAATNQAVVATYLTHAQAESAVRLLSDGGVPLSHISIIGRHFETREDIQGFYHPGDAALEGAGMGAWIGGIFGLMAGALGFFVFPFVGALMVLGPLAGLIAGAIGGAGVGALINGLIAAGVPKEQALKYQERLQAGEFLVLVHGSGVETALAHTILQGTNQTHVQAYETSGVDEHGRSYPQTRM